MPLTEPQAVNLVTRMAMELRLRQGDIRTWNDYYDGVHRLKYASDSWSRSYDGRFKNFSDNWCGVVANSPAERLAVTGIQLPGADTSDDELWRTWQIHGGDAESSAGFVDVQVAARSFALVWGEDAEITWESPEEVIVAYEPGSHTRRTASLKVWREDDNTEFAVLYLPDEVWKFQRLTNATNLIVTGGDDPFVWRPRDISTEPNPQPNPMGLVPVVELPNRPRTSGVVRSEIAGVASMQDAINLLWAYLFTTADFASFPQRVVMGQEPPKVPILDEQGNQVGVRDVPLERFGQDRVVWLTGKDSSIGQWEAANLQQFTDIIEVQVGHVAAQTRTPQHYLVGKMANLSAEALVAAESGLVKKVEEQQTFLGPRIQELFRLIALAKGDTVKADAVRSGRVRWRDAESRSETQMADKIIKLRQAGFPFEWLVTQVGADPTEIANILSLREKELREASQADIAAMFGVGGDGTGQ